MAVPAASTVSPARVSASAITGSATRNSRAFLGTYVYHCHFLEHSSLGMMAQMEIVP